MDHQIRVSGRIGRERESERRTAVASGEPHLEYVRLAVAVAVLGLELLHELPLLALFLLLLGRGLDAVPRRERRVVLGHVARVRPERVLLGRRAREQRGLEADAALVERDRVSEDADGRVGPRKGQGVGEYADGRDGIPEGGRAFRVGRSRRW